MLETLDDIQILDIDGRHHCIADGQLSGEQAQELELDLEQLTKGEVMVIGDQPVTVVIYRKCTSPVLVEVRGRIYDKIKE